MTPIDLDPYKIEVIEGINDRPEPPNFEGNGKGCNGAYYIDKFHGALEAIDGYLEGVSGQYALYPEKVLPFVPEDVEVLTYGTYAFTADDFGKTLTADSNLGSGYTLAVTIPAGLVVTPGMQTYFGLKGGCRFSVVGGAGVTLNKFDTETYIDPGQVWVLSCTSEDTYSLYRVSSLRFTPSYTQTFIETPVVGSRTLVIAPVGMTVAGLYGLKVSQGSLVMSIEINGVAITGLSAVTVTDSPVNISAVSLNVATLGQRVSLNITSVDSPQNLEFTLSSVLPLS